MRYLVCTLGLWGLTAQAQLSTSAYRALGQPDLRQNGVNMVQGAELFAPGGVAIDASEGQRRLYIADTRNHRILAWQDARSFQSGAPATLVLAQPSLQHVNPLGIGISGLINPLGLAVDATTGHLYVADYGDNRVVRFPKPFANLTRIEPDAVYGQPNFASRGANTGGITDHSMRSPRAVAFDSRGNLWVADTGNNRVLRFPAGVLDAPNPSADLVVGQRDFVTAGANMNGGGMTAFGLDSPAGLVFDQQNNLYVADFDNLRVLKFPAPSSSAPAAMAVYGQAGFTTRVVSLQPTSSSLAGPMGLAVTAAGKLYVTVPNDNRVLVFPPGATTGTAAMEVLGQPTFTTNLPNADVFPRASAATFFGVMEVEVDAEGNIFVADAGNNRVLSFTPPAKTASRVLGQADFASNGANQIKPGSINAPYKMAIDYSQTPFPLYVSDTNNHRVVVWKDASRFRTGAPADLVIGQPDLATALPNVDTRGQATPSRTSLFAPRGIVLDAAGNLYVADAGNNRVLRYPRPVSQSGRITPDAVLGQPDFFTSLSAAVNASSLNQPSGLALGPDGRVFVSDGGNNRVLEFASNPGTGAAAVRVYGQPTFTTGTTPSFASAQTLALPQGLYVDGTYNLYVADSGANRVLVYPNTKDLPPLGGSASVVIGQTGFDQAGAGGTATRLRTPLDLVVDSKGSLYVSDSGNHRVLQFPSLLFLPISNSAATAVVGQRTMTGVTANWNSRDGLATAEGFFSPAGIYMDRRETLYVGDTGNNRVVHFLKAASVVSAAHFQASVPVAPGALVSLFGPGISEQTQLASALPLPVSLTGREVVINDELKAPLLFVSTGQVNMQLPSATPLGTVRFAVRVSETGELLAGGLVVAPASAPGFFTLSQDGKGQGAIVNQDGTLNGPTSRAPRGSVVTLFGTGQGAVNPAVADGEPAGSEGLSSTVAVPTSDGATCLTVQPSVCVAIGSTFGEILYSGLAPGFVGLWQINVQIPESALAGEAVPVRAVINATPSNIITMAIR